MPIIGITLVLMAVFLPAAFVPGLSGQMFAQFSLVIAVTALISAVNAATLKPTQCALWLRTPKPVEQRNFFSRWFSRGFERVYGGMENAYARLIGRMVRALGEEFIAKNVLPYTQLRRLIRPEEIADAICFMISNSAVSGELWADAGWHPSA